MHTRNVILSLLTLASTTCLALEPRSAVGWPPKAAPNQQEGKVPDFTDKNELCLVCHGDIMDVETARKDIPNLHRRHLESKKTAYKDRNRACLTCHEMITPSETEAPDKEGWVVMANVYHPNVLLDPAGVWKKLIVRPGKGMQYTGVEALRQSDPDPFKPALKRLVCVDCHGADSKIKTFYGAPEAAK